MRHSILTLTVGTALLLLVSCGSDDPLAPAKTKNTWTITSEASTTELDLGGGLVVSLSVPAGAVYQDLVLTWTAVTPEAGDLVSFQVEPAGAFLAQPITLEIDLPGTPSMPGMYFGSLADPLFVDADWDGSRLTAHIRQLGFAPDPTAKDGDGGGIVHIADEQCVAYRDVIQQMLDLYVADQRYERAARVVGAYEAMARHADCEEDLEAFVATHRQLACTGFTTARDALAASDFPEPDDFLELARPMLYWAGVLQVWAAECTPLDAGFAAIQAAYTRLVTLYGERIDDLDGSDPDAFTQFKRLAKDLIRIEEEALYLGVPNFAEDLHDVIDTLLGKLRDTAYRICRENETSIYLVELTQPRSYDRTRIADGPAPGPTEGVGRPPYDADSRQAA